MYSKILFLSHKFFPDIGGIESNSEILATIFSDEGFEVKLLTLSLNKTYKNAYPFEIIRNPTKIKLFKEHAWADLVFENNPCLRLAWPGLFFRRPSVIALNTWVTRSDGTKGIQDRLKILWFKRAKKIIAVSNAVRNKCWPKALVIENPYNNKLFKILPYIPRTLDFVFLGRLVSDKGIDQAISAIYRLSNSNLKKYSFTIIGDGPKRNDLQKLVVDLKLESVVEFRGALSGNELVTCLNRHKYILVPSRWEEPFGNVALEGMACGCIPIVSDGGGLTDAVGNAGVIFKRGSVDALVEAIKKVSQDKKLEAELRKNSISHLEKHEPRKVANQYIEVIKIALNKN